MKVKLLSSQKSKQKIEDILSLNNIIVDEKSSIVIAEDGYFDAQDYDVKIVFNENRIGEFADFIRNLGVDIVSEDMILGKHNETYTPINISDISYFNGINNDTYANVESGRSYLVRKKLYQLEEELFASGFFRINKSELINMKKIKWITPMFKGRLIIHLEGYETPFDISRNYTKAFKERLGF